MKNQTKIIIWVIGIILLLGLIFATLYSTGVLQSFLNTSPISGISKNVDGGYESIDIYEETITTSFGEVNLETPYLGSLTNNDPYRICNTGNSYITISNSKTINDDLIYLKSSIGGTESICGYNYIQVNVNFNKNVKIEGSCDIEGNVYRNSNFLAQTNHCEISTRDDRAEMQPITQSNTFTEEYKAGDTATFYVKTFSSVKSSVQAELTLNIEEEIIEKQTYYRLENEECKEINLIPSEVKNNDYDNLEECESNIIIGPEPEPEPEPSIDKPNYILYGALGILGIFIILIITLILRKKR